MQVAESAKRYYRLPDMVLQSGQLLAGAVLAYETFGRLNQQKNNAILVCHALTGDSHAAGTIDNPGWWDGLIGPDKAIDTNRYFVISSNVLGGCSGSSGPSSMQSTGRPYGLRFPTVTIRDMVQSQHHLVKSLGISRLKAVIGGSMGGMQVYEWAASFPEMVEVAVPIATCGQFSAMGIAFNNVMRQAIYNDPDWMDGDYYGISFPKNGLDTARRLGMITYRSFGLYEERFGNAMVPSQQPISLESEFQVERYLNYQGKKLVERFDANSYIYLLKAMDLHNIANGRGSYQQALDRIQARCLLIGIDSDFLFPPGVLQEDSLALQNLGKDAEYREIRSIHGHDAFLIEFDAMSSWIAEFLDERGGRS